MAKCRFTAGGALAVHEIRLQHGVWSYDDSEAALLGPPGGFGSVYKGWDGKGLEVAVKRLHLNAQHMAHRELKIADQLIKRDLKHVVSVLDYGQDALSDGYFIVMPRCDKSLQQHLDLVGPLDTRDALNIANQIVAGLLEVSTIVHRDLKPSNVLWHDGVWKLSDFGIAKFVEDTTSLLTLQQFRSPPYAAPEQWMSLRASAETDVYALGCMMHTLIKGAPPFWGAIEAVQRSHLYEVPPTIVDLSPRLAAFVAQMLRKAPAARPSLSRCAAIFSAEPERVPAGNRADLADVAARIALEKAQQEALEERARSFVRGREALFGDAQASWERLVLRLEDELRQVSDNVIPADDGFIFGRGAFAAGPPVAVDSKAGGAPNLGKLGWDVVAQAKLSVISNPAQGPRYSWNTSALYVDRGDKRGCRWIEVGFHQLAERIPEFPLALDVDDRRLENAIAESGPPRRAATRPGAATDGC